MADYILKSALVAEIEKTYKFHEKRGNEHDSSICDVLYGLSHRIDTIEVKEVDEQKERMSECPYRKVGCTVYECHVLECTGACGWVVDYSKLKELKAQKGESYDSK